MEIEAREGGSKKSMESISILVVDDDTACLAAVATTLKMFKYEVVTAKHANDALSTLRIKGGGFDLVISEVHMPDMNGFELQQAIAQEFKNLPVVLMSGDPDEGVALKALENGAVFFICKPVCPDDVRDIWQFAAMKKPSQVTIHGEEITGKCKEIVSLSSMNEGGGSKIESPRNEGSNSKHQQKKAKMMWNNSLRARFLEAIRIIGLDRAVPKKILEVMNVPGLTREHVASHLQKYRIFLKKVSNASCRVQEAPDHMRLRSSVNFFTRPTSLTLPPLTLKEFPYQKLNFSSPLISPTTYNSSSIPPSMTTPSDCLDLNHKRLTGTVSEPFHGNATAVDLSNLGENPLLVENNINRGDQLSDVVGDYDENHFMVENNLNRGDQFSDVVGDYVENPFMVENNINHGDQFSDVVGDYVENPLIVENNINHGDQLSDVVGDFSENAFMVENNINRGDQLSDVVGDYGGMMQLPSNPHLHGANVWNAGGINHEEAYNPMFHTTYPDQVSILNQAQTHVQQNEGVTLTTSNVYGDDMMCWDHNNATSIDPAPNQQCMVEPQDQLIPNSYAQLINDDVMLLPPPPPKEQDEDEFVDSLFV